MWKIFLVLTLISGAVAQSEGGKYPCKDNAILFYFRYNNTDCSGIPLAPVCWYPSTRSSGYNGLELNGGISFENKETRKGELLSSIRVLGTFRLTFVTETNQSYFSYVIGYEPNGTNCLILKDLIPFQNWNDYRLNLTQFVPPPFINSHLIFTEGNDYQGNYHWVPTDEKGNYSPYPITAKSYIHVGNDSWVIYSGKEFTGERTCFFPTNLTLEATEVRKTNVNFIVGSVKRDTEGTCGNNGGFGPSQIPNFVIGIVFARVLNLSK